jgi:outer membrane cobalamin receptor
MVNALTLIPGIHFLGGQTQGITIRGGAPTENLVLLDGITVLGTSQLFGNLSVINSKYIQQVFVSRGGFGAEYGGRVSGIVEMTGKNGSGPKPTIDLSANLLHANGYVGIPLGKKLSLAGAFRKSYTQLWPNYLFK